MTLSRESQHKGSLIYLVGDDELLVKDLMIRLEQADYNVQHFSASDDIEVAFEQEVPAAILMDVVFKEGGIVGADVIARLQAKEQACPPLIFISIHDDIEAHLAAARAGASRYFCKPLDMEKLTHTLNSLTVQTIISPYRVLLIDDDETLLEYYTILLREAGMVIEALSNPMQSLAVLADFKPDIIVLDVHMPEYSGSELAQVIRQDDAWAMIPIMFLSTESEINSQLVAMNPGGEDFLVKPVEADHLVSAVTARVKRARWTARLTQDLKISLRESEYQQIAMNQHNIVSCADITGRIINLNDKFCEISGYSREELLGQNHRILKSGYHPRSFFEEMWTTISQGKVWHGTICNHRKNGGEYWVESTMVPFLDDKGKPYKYVSVRTDITALRQNEERLQRSQEFANIGTWDWNIRTGGLYWSKRIAPLFGYKDFVPETSYKNFLAAVYPDDRELVIDAVNACIEEGIEYDIEHRVIWPDNSVHWVSESGNVVRAENGVPLHMLGVVQDIDARKHAEWALIEAREEADHANAAKSQFLSSMSHELRTPMNAIMGFSQLLKMEADQLLNESQLENVNEIITAGGHLLELINGVLDLAKIEAGYIDLSIEAVVLGEILGESLQLITPLAQKRGIEINLTQNGADITLQQLLSQQHAVWADRIRLKQVLLNLLSNAVKYNNENGKLTIDCHYTGDNQIRISIIDTGEGVALEQQGQLFKAFNRLGADQSEIEGTGIGLIITKNIVELMGGSIGVDSQPGKGSTFWFELPGNALLSAAECSADKNENASLLPADMKYKHTILYIEDNPANLRLVTQLLGRLNHVHMWSAHEPMLGLDLAAEHKPDLILLDINLPGIDGFEVLRRLRQHETTYNIPVLAISANAMPEDIERGLKAGFDDYITKPIDVKLLLKAVTRALDEDE